MSETYTQLGDMSDAQFERLWNNPGTTFVWKSSIQKRGKSGVRHALYSQCLNPKDMRKLYQEQQSLSDAFKNVSAKEEFKWDFKRGNVTVNVPQQSQSPFFVRTVIKKVDHDSTCNNSSTAAEKTRELKAEDDQPFNSQTQLTRADVLASPSKQSQTHQKRKSQKSTTSFPNTPIKVSEKKEANPPKKRIKATASIVVQPSTTTWDEIFNQSQDHIHDVSDEYVVPPLPMSPAKTTTIPQSSPAAPKTPIPFHFRQKLEESQPKEVVIKAVPLSYDSSWLKKSAGSSAGAVNRLTDSPNKRPWYSNFKN